jgi:hypothetical protein
MLMDEMLLAEAPTCMLNRGLRYLSLLVLLVQNALDEMLLAEAPICML